MYLLRGMNTPLLGIFFVFRDSLLKALHLNYILISLQRKVC